MSDEDPFHNEICDWESMGGRFGAHRPECPTAIAQATDVKR